LVKFEFGLAEITLSAACFLYQNASLWPSARCHRRQDARDGRGGEVLRREFRQ